MADDVVANPGAAGATFRAFSDGTIDWPAAVVTFVTGGSAGAWTLQQVDSTHGLPTAILAGTAEIGNVKNSGTFAVQAAQSGTWNINNVSGTITLPTGAATGAKQDTGNTSLSSIDGKITACNTGAVVISSGSVTADTELTTADLDTGAGTDTKAVVGVVVAASGGSVNLSGNSGNKDGGTIRVVLATDQPQLTNKLLVTPDANSAVNVAQINGVTPLMGNGASGTGAQRVTLASDSTGQVTLASGAQVQPVPGASGGLSFSYFTSAATNNKTQVKGSAGQLYFISVQSIHSAPIYLKVFNNTSAGVTAGTTAADFQFMCPANGTAANGAGVVFSFDPGIAMSTGITVMLTTGIGTTDNTSTAANIAVVTIGYK